MSRAPALTRAEVEARMAAAEARERAREQERLTAPARREAEHRAAAERRRQERQAVVARRQEERRASAAADAERRRTKRRLATVRRQQRRQATAARLAEERAADRARERAAARTRKPPDAPTRTFHEVGELLALVLSMPDRILELGEADQQLARSYLALMRLHGEGWSWSRVAAALNADGLHTRTGARWSGAWVAREVREFYGQDTVSPAVMAYRRSSTTVDDVPSARRRRLLDSKKSRGKLAPRHLPAPRAWSPVRPEELPPEFADYLTSRATVRMGGTVDQDRRVLCSVVGYLGRDAFWSNVDGKALGQYQRDLAGPLPHPSTRAHHLSALRMFLGHAYTEGWTARDLSRRIAVPQVPRNEPRPIPRELLAGMFAVLRRETFRDLHDRAFVHFLISTGCRRSEVVSVDRADLTRGPEVRIRGVKGGRMRTVLLTTDARDAVDEYLRRRGEDDCPALFINWREHRAPAAGSKRWSPPHEGARRRRRRVDGKLRLDRGGGELVRTVRRLSPDAAAYLHQRLRRRYPDDPGLAAFTSLHVARHTTATALLEVTPDARLVQEILGHATLETLRVYTEITDRRKRAAYAPGSAFATLLASNGP